MLRAYLQNKLSRALSAAGVEDRAIRHALGRSEDALTSSVLVRVRYLSTPLQWDLLTEAQPRPLSGEAWPSVPEGGPIWSFWPSYDPAPGFGKTWFEPDVVVRWGDYVLVFEAKHHGRQYAWQWASQVSGILAGERIPVNRLLYVAVGGTHTDVAKAVAEDAARLARVSGVRFYQLDWPSLHAGIQRILGHDHIGPGERAILADASEALEAAGHYGERGWAPLGAVTERPTDGKAPTIFQWSRLDG